MPRHWKAKPGAKKRGGNEISVIKKAIDAIKVGQSVRNAERTN